MAAILSCSESSWDHFSPSPNKSENANQSSLIFKAPLSTLLLLWPRPFLSLPGLLLLASNFHLQFQNIFYSKGWDSSNIIYILSLSMWKLVSSFSLNLFELLTMTYQSWADGSLWNHFFCTSLSPALCFGSINFLKNFQNLQSSTQNYTLRCDIKFTIPTLTSFSF